jgi:uncharacterized caspase-like protein
MATNDDAAARVLEANMPINVIAASKGRQFSLESASFGGGVFTSALVDVFEKVDAYDTDGNGALEFTELYRELKRRVVLQTAGQQTPWIARSGLVGNVPLL